MCINCTWTVASVGLTFDTSCHKKGFSWMQVTPLNASQVGENPGAQWPLPLFPVPYYPLPPIIQLPCQDITTQQKSLRTWPAWLAMALGPQESRVAMGSETGGVYMSRLDAWTASFWLVVRIVFIKIRVVTPSITTKDVHKTTKLHTSGHYNKISIYNYSIKSIVSSRTNFKQVD